MIYFLIFIWLLVAYIVGSIMAGATHGSTSSDLPKFILVALGWPIYVVYLLYCMIVR